jgi:regulator of sigma E protease
MIAQVAYNEASKGWASLLIFLTFLSANLALVNFLPIPVLDGGHMVFLAYEGVTGRPPNEKVQQYALMVGLAMILCLMVFVFGNDIMGLIKAYV